MALIICTECGKKVSDSASVCPNCGKPVDISDGVAEKKINDIKRKSNISRIVGISVVAFIVLLIVVPKIIPKGKLSWEKNLSVNIYENDAGRRFWNIRNIGNKRLEGIELHIKFESYFYPEEEITYGVSSLSPGEETDVSDSLIRYELKAKKGIENDEELEKFVPKLQYITWK